MTPKYCFVGCILVWRMNPCMNFYMHQKNRCFVTNIDFKCLLGLALLQVTHNYKNTLRSDSEEDEAGVYIF